MRTPTLPASRIAEMLDGTIEGDPDVLLSGFSSIENGKASDLTYMGNARYEDFVYTTNAGAILVRYDFEPKAPYTATLIRVSDPYEALNHLVELLKAESTEETGVSPLAVVDDTVEVSEDVYIGPLAYVGAYTKLGKGVRILPHVYVGKECQIGDHTKIYPMAVVSDHTVIGERCIIHSGSVIGADGFGFAPTETGYEKVPQMGNVVIEDDVEIGANTCIDRAAIDSTIVKKGAKVDNLVQLAHNTVTGAHTVISAQTGVAGSTKIGDWNVLAGQVGVAGHLTTADKVTLAAKTGVLASIKDVGGTYFGIPAQPHRTAMKAAALFPHLPEIDKELYQLKFEVESLKKELEELKSKRK